MQITKASRKEIIGEVAKRSAVGYKTADHMFNKLSEVIEEKLKEGKQINIPYIGTFYFVEKDVQISNLTKQEIPKHKQIKFRFNKDLARWIRVTSRER